MVKPVGPKDLQREPSTAEATPLRPSVRGRVLFAGSVFALLPWAANIASPGLFPWLMVPITLLTAGILPFLVSVSRPLGRRQGARLGRNVVLAGLAVTAAFIPVMALVEWQLWVRPLYLLILHVVLLPVTWPMAMGAGWLGGYRPDVDGVPPPRKAAPEKPRRVKGAKPSPDAAPEGSTQER